MTNDKNPFGLGLDSENTANESKEEEDKQRVIKLGHIKVDGAVNSFQDKTTNTTETTLKEKFFKEVAILLPSEEETHITETGQMREELKHLLGEIPQFKNAVTTETFKKMTDKDLNEFIQEYYS